MNITGSWDIEIAPTRGSRLRTAVLTFAAEEGGLKGKFNSKAGLELIHSIEVNGSTLRFSLAGVVMGRRVTLRYEVTIDGDTLTGSANSDDACVLKVAGTRRRVEPTITSAESTSQRRGASGLTRSRAEQSDALKTGERRTDIDRSLIFIISPPRSGSTLAARMLGSNPEIFATPELHLIPPLYHLGYYNPAWREQTAEFEDHESYRSYSKKLASYGIKSIVDWLPNFEDDYVEALRSYTNTIYSKLLGKSGRTFLLDKTPHYCRYADFLAKLYPTAKYIALVRNPIKTGLSLRKYIKQMRTLEQATSAAHTAPKIEDSRSSRLDVNDVALRSLKHYLDGMLRFLEMKDLSIYFLKYEDLVFSAETECKRICAFLDIEYTPAMLEYDSKGFLMRGISGDPYTVSKYNKPMPELAGRPPISSQEELDFASAVLSLLRPDEFKVLGYDSGTLSEGAESVERRQQI